VQPTRLVSRRSIPLNYEKKFGALGRIRTYIFHPIMHVPLRRRCQYESKNLKRNLKVTSFHLTARLSGVYPLQNLSYECIYISSQIICQQVFLNWLGALASNQADIRVQSAATTPSSPSPIIFLIKNLFGDILFTKEIQIFSINKLYLVTCKKR